jgi:hypothetical protein
MADHWADLMVDSMVDQMVDHWAGPKVDSTVDQMAVHWAVQLVAWKAAHLAYQ